MLSDIIQAQKISHDLPHVELEEKGNLIEFKNMKVTTKEGKKNWGKVD